MIKEELTRILEMYSVSADELGTAWAMEDHPLVEGDTFVVGIKELVHRADDELRDCAKAHMLWHPDSC